jgi:hypothetical protein
MSGEPKSRRSRSTPKPPKSKDSREKCTLLIQRDTSIKLSTLAAIKGVDRSTLAEEILAQALRHVVISLRSPSSEAGEGMAEPAEQEAA